MDWNLANHQNTLLRFLAALFAMVGFPGGTAFFRQSHGLTQFALLRRDSKLSPALVRLYLRQATLKFLWLTQVRFCRSLPSDDDGRPFLLPAIQLRDDCELLSVQNIAGRVAALYRAWDNLEAQAGRLVRWRNRIDAETADDPSGDFTAWLFVPARSAPPYEAPDLAIPEIRTKIPTKPLGRDLPAQPARAPPDTS